MLRDQNLQIAVDVVRTHIPQAEDHDAGQLSPTERDQFGKSRS